MKKFYNTPEFIAFGLNAKDVVAASGEPKGYVVYSENGGVGDGDLDSFVFPV